MICLIEDMSWNYLRIRNTCFKGNRKVGTIWQDMARLTGEDADGHIISTEEEWLLASNGFISKDEMYKIMMHLTEKLYEYEVADLNMCEWKRNSAFPETINNPHVSKRENIATTKFCPYCGKKIKIVN